MNQQDEKAFDDFWNVVIMPVIDSSFNEMDKDYVTITNAKCKDLNVLHDVIEKKYKELRHQTKILFYKESNKDRLLDSRKLGAVICAVIANNRPIFFNEDEAGEYAQKKREIFDDKAYNEWACDNFLVNFKIAYLASVGLVYHSCLYCLSKNEPLLEKDFEIEKKEAFRNKLEAIGRMCNYPKCLNFDAFGINMIISLARTCLSNNELDIEMYALQLWQIEMYTYRTLELMQFVPELEV